MKRMTDAQFAEIESSILYFRNRLQGLLESYAKYTDVRSDADAYGNIDDIIYNELNAALASLECAYENLV